MTEKQLTEDLLDAVMTGARPIPDNDRPLPALGERVVHRRGLWLRGRFEPSEVARAAIGEGIFARETEVLARFSAMNDNETAGARPNIYGLAVRFGLDDRPADLLMLNLPILPVSTGRNFLTLATVLSELRRPEAGAADLYSRLKVDWKPEVGHKRPSVQGTLAFVRSAARGRPRSLAEATYHSIHAFRLPRHDGLPGDVARLSWRPEAGDRTLVTKFGTGQWPDGDESLFRRNDDGSTCFRETSNPHVAPIAFSLDLLFATPEIESTDSSRAFASTSPFVSAGRLVLDPHAEEDMAKLVDLRPVRFKPHEPPGGLRRLDGDDIMETRAAVYGAVGEFDPSARRAEALAVRPVRHWWQFWR